ncbi:penicillin-binding protein 2 [Aureimonas altamirensis]|uniref:peptidoglycan D,D-transpeptidase FtsI family protein n=1 Tax=Aureimonas altamirensis TaxID=370622 RepID=UPI001E46AB88|nr:penicillin-binding protein 2 [Aureimonas altamirensis]UHD45646.1 penicillin-binding protein 2 [Aureimonas altamirensis]
MNQVATSFRTYVLLAVFSAAFLAIFGRLVHLTTLEPAEPVLARAAPSHSRPDILDRNGEILARDIVMFSVYAEPRRVIDPDETVEQLLTILPELNAASLYRRLSGKSGFTWVSRSITPAKQQAIHNLGLPGIGFRPEVRRLYPNGGAAAQVLGAVNIDNLGIAGIESWIDESGLNVLRSAGMDYRREDLDPVNLSIDLYVQHAFADELRKAIDHYDAIGGAGLVLDVNSGEVVSLVSLPDFDPNNPTEAHKKENINRINVGVYEMGSTFKALTMAMGLDSTAFNIHSVVDATNPLRFGRFSISDYRGEKRPLNMPEAFLVSSNIVFAKMAMQVGVDRHKEFLRALGQLTRLTTELPESAAPIVPRNWGAVNTATIAFGHGLAVTPLQASMGVAALVNGGRLIRPTFVKDTPVEDRIIAEDVIAPSTGEALRYLMRLNGIDGSARRATIAGYHVGGKTGTAEKVIDGRYAKGKVMTSFMGLVPAHEPKYLILVMLDEPKPVEGTHGFRTAGWNAVPTAKAILNRILPMMRMPPQFTQPQDPFPNIVRARAHGHQHFLAGALTQ